MRRRTGRARRPGPSEGRGLAGWWRGAWLAGLAGGRAAFQGGLDVSPVGRFFLTDLDEEQREDEPEPAVRPGVEVGGQQRAFRGGLQPDGDGDLDGAAVVYRPAVRPVIGGGLDLDGLRGALPLREIPGAQAGRAVGELVDRLDAGIPFQLVPVVGEVVECFFRRAADLHAVADDSQGRTAPGSRGIAPLALHRGSLRPPVEMAMATAHTARTATTRDPRTGRPRRAPGTCGPSARPAARGRAPSAPARRRRRPPRPVPRSGSGPRTRRQSRAARCRPAPGRPPPRAAPVPAGPPPAAPARRRRAAPATPRRGSRCAGRARSASRRRPGWPARPG